MATVEKEIHVDPVEFIDETTGQVIGLNGARANQVIEYRESRSNKNRVNVSELPCARRVIPSSGSINF